MAAQPDVCGTVVLRDQPSGRQHGETGVAKHVVGDEGAQLSQNPPGARTAPHVGHQRYALVHQVVGPPLATRRGVGLPPWREGGAPGARRLVDVLKLSQEHGEALLQQLHVVSLHLPGEERRRRQVGEEEDLGPLDAAPAAQVATLIPNPFVHAAHAGPGVALGVFLQAVIQSLVQTLACARAAETLERLTEGETVLLVQADGVLPFGSATTVRAHEAADASWSRQVVAAQAARAVISAHAVTVPQEQQQHARGRGGNVNLAIPDVAHRSGRQLPRTLHTPFHRDPETRLSLVETETEARKS